MKHQTTFLLLLIAGVLLFMLGSHFSSKSSMLPLLTSPSLSPQTESTNSPAPTPSDSTISCVDPQKFAELTGRTYELERETPLDELKAVECEYSSPDVVNSVHPSIHYVYYQQGAGERWGDTRAEQEKNPGFRRIEGKENLFAIVNPVAEVAQATFYGKTEKSYIEMTYSPIQEDVGIILDKGVKITAYIEER
jgi:hypothetical protein